MFKWEVIKLGHKGGTKFYEVSTLSGEFGALTIFRFGKVNAFGLLQVKYHIGSTNADSEVNKKIADKLKGGYYVEGSPDVFSYNSLEALKASKFLTYVRMMPSNMAMSIDPALGPLAKGKPAPQDFEDINKNGLLPSQLTQQAVAESRRLLAQQVKDAAAAAEAKLIAEQVERNAADPNWGIF